MYPNDSTPPGLSEFKYRFIRKRKFGTVTVVE